MTLDDVRAAAEASGLAFRGAFHPDPDDVPAGASARTIVMLGFVGGEQWANFTSSPEFRDSQPSPLDRWSYRVVSDLAGELGAQAFFPFTAPLMPFIRWAQKAEPVYPSAIGMLIHPDFGLWHAWRGALGFDAEMELPPRDERPRPCDSCDDKPCLSACPVSAFDGSGAFDVASCGTHVRGAWGADCRTTGCLSRRACPVGSVYTYSAQQAAFHMRAFHRF